MEKSRTVQYVNTQKYDLRDQASGGLTMHCGRKATRVGGVDSLTVIVGHDVMEHDALDLGHWQQQRAKSLHRFILGRDKKALSPGIVIPSNSSGMDRPDGYTP